MNNFIQKNISEQKNIDHMIFVEKGDISDLFLLMEKKFNDLIYFML